MNVGMSTRRSYTDLFGNFEGFIQGFGLTAEPETLNPSSKCVGMNFFPS